MEYFESFIEHYSEFLRGWHSAKLKVDKKLIFILMTDKEPTIEN